MVDVDRVRVLVAVASFAYALALHQGVIEAKKRPIAIKKGRKGEKDRPAVSLFRYGYRRLRRIASNARQFIGLVLRIVRKLTRAITPPMALEVGYSKSVQ